MGRPTTPLMTRRSALETALRIVDDEGLDALSIRSLARALNVNAATLYHHFDGKDDILTGVAQLALADMRTPTDAHEPLQSWLPWITRRLRATLVEHPALVPVMLRRAPLGIGARELDKTVARLMREGLPLDAIMPLLESLELMAFTSALQVIGERTNAGDLAGLDDLPHLQQAHRARRPMSDEVFDLACESLIDSYSDSARAGRLASSARL